MAQAEPYCSVCGKQMPDVRPDGTVRNHMNESRQPCAGSRMAPEVDTPTLRRGRAETRFNGWNPIR